jgi:hypothetical protein
VTQFDAENSADHRPTALWHWSPFSAEIRGLGD